MYSTYDIFMHINRKAYLVCNFNCVLKVKDYPRSQPVTYNVIFKR